MALGKLAILGIAAVVVAAPAVAFVALNPGTPTSTIVEPTSQKTATKTDGSGVALSPLKDVLWSEIIAETPVGLEMVPMFDYTFDVDGAKKYNMIQADVRGVADGFYIEAMPSIKIIDPKGEVAAEWAPGEFFFLYPAAVAGDKPFTIAAIPSAMPGTYKIEVMGGSTPFELSITAIRGAAPDFKLEDALGKGTTKLSDLRGKVVLIDLFATWCGPCKQTMSVFKEVYGKYTRSQFEIVSVDVDAQETDSQIAAFMNANSGVWWAGRDDGTVNENYGSNYIPTMAIANKDGMLIYRHIGSGFTAEDLQKVIDAGLAA